MIHIPGITSFMMSPVQLQIHYHSEMHYPLRHIAWQLGWKSSWFHYSCLLCAWKTSTEWMMPRSHRRSIRTLVLLDHGCKNIWMPRCVKLRQKYQESSFLGWIVQMALQRGFYQMKCLRFWIFEPVMRGVLLIPGIPSRHHFSCSGTKYLVTFTLC